MSGQVAAPGLRPLFTITMHVGSAWRLGSDVAPQQASFIDSGHFTGDRLRGTVISGGNDWQTVLPDGTLLIDCRLVLQTDDGALIAMAYQGVRHGPPDVIERLGRGDPVDPADYYFRITPRFSTNAPDYLWLNRIVAVGSGHRRKDGPVYAIFELT